MLHCEMDESNISCGVYQLYGINKVSNEEILDDVGEYLFGEERYGSDKAQQPAFIVFSNTDRKFADYLAKKKLGKVTVRGPLVNPNSKNKIYMCVWELTEKNRKALCKWWKKQNCTCSCE